MGVFIRTLANALLNPSDTGNANESLQALILATRGTLARAVNTLAQLIGALVWSGHQEKGAWRGSVGRGAGVGADLQAIVQKEYEQWHYLLTHILPKSLAWVEEDIAKRHLGDLSKRLAELERQMRDLIKWRAQVTNWQGRIVNPTLKSYNDFWSYFKGAPKTTLDVWVRWFQHQDEFTDWATPMMAQKLIAYLAHPQQKLLRDTLAGMMVDAWSDDADAVWASVERWLTSNT